MTTYTFTTGFYPNVLTLSQWGVVGTKARSLSFASGGGSTLQVVGTVRGHASDALSLSYPITSTLMLTGRVKGTVTPATVFSEFAHYTAAATVDPVVSLVKGKVSGVAAYDNTQPSAFRRVSMSLSLPNDTSTTRRAAYVAPGVRIAGMTQNNGINIDGTQVELALGGTTTPSAYEPARALQVGVRPNRLNYASNPSWRSTSGTTVVRTNLATNPSAENPSTGWSTNNGSTWTVSQDSTVKRSGTYSRKSVCVSPGVTRSLMSNYNVGGVNIPATAGLAYTASVYMAHNATENANIFVNVSFLASDGTTILSTVNGTKIPVPGDSTFYRASVTGTAPTNTVYIRVLTGVDKVTNLAVAGDASWADDCLVEQAGALLPYFDGRTAATPDGLTYGWTGTVDASASTAQGSSFTTAPFVAYTGSVSWQSSPGVLRIFAPNGPSSGLWGFGSLAPSLINPDVGSYWGMRFKVRQIGGSQAVSIVPRLGWYTQAGANAGTTGVVDAVTSLAPDGPWVEIVCTPRLPAPANAYTVRPLVYTSGTTPAGSMLEFKECIIERLPSGASTPGPYFDGSFGADYLWEAGTSANTSRSYYYEDYAVRAYLLKQVLAENCPLGTIPSVPQFAVLPRF